MNTTITTVTPFDFEDLPDSVSQAEALWHLTALSYVYALGLGYMTLLDEPDTKAAWNLQRAADYLERSVRRAYPGPEGEFLMALARRKAREGVDRQKAAQVSHVSIPSPTKGTPCTPF